MNPNISGASVISAGLFIQLVDVRGEVRKALIIISVSALCREKEKNTAIRGN